MKALCAIFWAATVALCSGWAHGATTPIKDPQVIIAGGDGSFPVGSSFSFISPSGTSPISLPDGSPCLVGQVSVLDCLFANASGFNWSSLTFSISPGGQKGPFSCSALAYFAGCSFNEAGTKVTFFGGNGIAAGKDFVVAVIGWSPGTTFDGEAKGQEASGTAFKATVQYTPASEPRTAAVFLNGQVALVRWERLRRYGVSSL